MPEKTYPQKPGESAAAYGTRLTAQALGQSQLPYVGHYLNFPANYPISPDLEIRTDGSTTPPLMQRIGSALDTFGQQARAAWDQRGTLWGQPANTIASPPDSRLKSIIPGR